MEFSDSSGERSANYPSLDTIRRESQSLLERHGNFDETVSIEMSDNLVESTKQHADFYLPDGTLVSIVREHITIRNFNSILSPDTAILPYIAIATPTNQEHGRIFWNVDTYNMSEAHPHRSTTVVSNETDENNSLREYPAHQRTVHPLSHEEIKQLESVLRLIQPEHALPIEPDIFSQRRFSLQ